MSAFSMGATPSTIPSVQQAYELVKALKLQKAMQTGDSMKFNAAPGNAYPLKPESLDKTLINTSYTMDDIQLFKMIHREPVDNSITQHNELTSYGENPGGGFFPEGGAPPQDSATFVRQMNQIKYQGVAGGITHQLSLQNTINESALTLETQTRTMHLLGKIERSLWHADSRLSALQYDGFFAQIDRKSPSTNIIDMHGKPLTQDVLIDGTTMIRSDPNYGKIDHLFCSIQVKGDIQRSFIPQSRILAMDPSNDGVLRTGIRAIETPAGDVDLVGTTMMNRVGTMPTRPLGPSLAIPGAPTVGTVTTPSVAFSNYAATDAGSYSFFIVACNDVGSSAPVQVGTGPIAVAAGASVQFTWTPAMGNDTKWLEVWKTTANGALSTLSKVMSVPNTDPVTQVANTAQATVTEFNEYMAGCETAIGMQMQKDVVRLDVLAAMLRIPQPLIGTTIPFLLVSYLCPVLLAPRRILKFKNIGRLAPQTVLV